VVRKRTYWFKHIIDAKRKGLRLSLVALVVLWGIVRRAVLSCRLVPTYSGCSTCGIVTGRVAGVALGGGFVNAGPTAAARLWTTTTTTTGTLPGVSLQNMPFPHPWFPTWRISNLANPETHKLLRTGLSVDKVSIGLTRDRGFGTRRFKESLNGLFVCSLLPIWVGRYYGMFGCCSSEV
jgi:hypothetical protein